MQTAHLMTVVPLAPLGQNLLRQDAANQAVAVTAPLLSGEDMMGLGYYSYAPFPEMTGLGTIEEWASTTEGKIVSGAVVALQFLRPAGAVAAGIHGYRRYDDSLLAATGWAALGFLFPVITNIVAMAQGFGRPRKSLGCCPI